MSPSRRQIFELQLDILLSICESQALCKDLGGGHTFEFVEGSIPCPPAPGLAKIFSRQTEYYAFFTDFATTFRTALDDLEKYLQEEGSFDGVIGFSQGACLAASLMIRHAQKQPPQSIFRCAVFICGIEPWNVSEGRNYNVAMDGEVIQVPTATIYGSKDYQWGEASLALSRLCNSESKEIYDHGRAHEMPRPSELTSGMARTIRKVIDRALYMH
ncbi:hypothetical protein MMC17_002210 [Xylographa soralifera]|nr:hypothetical protein [Xylographa soralifera]